MARKWNVDTGIATGHLGAPQIVAVDIEDYLRPWNCKVKGEQRT